MGIGVKIKKLREQKGVSQAELAAMLDIEQGSLSKIESGKTERIDVLLMDKVCKIFDKDFSYFLTDKTINNNIETNNGTGLIINEGTINQFPEELMNLAKEILHAHQQQNQRLLDLESKLQGGKEA